MTTTVGGAGAARPNLSDLIAPQLPYLRRFARALCGEQRAGDAFVAAVIEALIADRDALDLSLPPRVGLYALFHRLWSSAGPGGPAAGDAGVGAAQLRIARLTPRSRQMLLLTTLEGFSLDDAAEIMGVGRDEAERLARDARAELDRQMRSRVLIIEDEPIIALDIESIVAGMGHEVVGIADTRASAVAMAEDTRPDLVLADIQLADGSSGIDAVEDILARMKVPVIFVTAFPERLLTGERPEPTFLVTKPFRTGTVEAAVSQVLFLSAAR
ncbi:response regulator [Limibaculum sp. FT325]|uniref:response regulator n=1 Tax=Thermohalobaculum sediminis TaxID=2939436 RepID=UPI0020C0F914|nr:response regulator [Limibaculum sediminis]MCL5777524.1 response regulator [Limibaculum sediminis]